jgi:lambda repressor-like predicted transcriptional regulator
MGVIERELAKSQALWAAKMLHGYLECDDVIQAGIRNTLATINDPATDEDDRVMALHTLAEALFPERHDGLLGRDLAELDDELATVESDLQQEETHFAERLAALMHERGLSQADLARRMGIGQPAISNMLNRRARPQQATVNRFAEALGVEPSELWRTV